MARKIKRIKVRFVSLVPKGANNLSVAYKSDGQVELALASKGMDEAGEIAALVYIPGIEDLDGDSASPAVVKEMCYSFMQEGASLDMRHDGKPIEKSRAFVAESFVVNGADQRFSGLKTYDGHAIDPVGGWAVVIKVMDEELRKLYREGKWNGVSLGGLAEFEPASKEEQERVSFWASVKALFSKKEMDMDPKELKELLEGVTKGQAAFAQTLKELVEGQKAQAATQKAQAESLAKLDKEFATRKEAEEADAKKAADAAIIARAEKAEKELEDLKKAAGKSNQGTNEESLNKEVDEAVARARKVAQAYNKGGK